MSSYNHIRCTCLDNHDLPMQYHVTRVMGTAPFEVDIGVIPLIVYSIVSDCRFVSVCAGGGIHDPSETSTSEHLRTFK